MPLNIDWDLVRNNGFQESFDRGVDMGERIRRQSALSAFASDPTDPKALQAVMAVDPRLGVQLADYQDKRAFREGVAEYMTGNALLPTGSPSPSNVPVNALAPAPAQPATAANPVSPSQSQPEPEANAALAGLGRPRTDRDRAFLRMVQSNPIEALKIQSELRDNFLGQIEAEHDFYSLAVDELSRTNDEASWQQALQSLGPRAEALGGNLLDHVPQAYPGEEGVRGLLEKAMPIKDRLGHWLREANIEADNVRADRNTDSMIETRDRRASEYERNNRERAANQRRGQNISSSDRRRGQDMTDSRVRSSRSSARGSSSPRSSSSDRPTATDAKGNKVEWNGKAWVPVN